MSIDVSLKISRLSDEAGRRVESSFKKLSSGKRINNAADDAAGLAIAEQLASSSRVTAKANDNISFGESALQIAEGATNQLSDIFTRQQELAVQSANGTYSDDQRAALDVEFRALSQEAQRIVDTTEFNGVKLLNNNSVTIQAGDDSSSDSQISTPKLDYTSLAASLSTLDISSVNSARAALDAVGTIADTSNALRGSIGATESRLESAKDNNNVKRVNYQEAESRIRDVDLASETALLTSNRIKQDVGTALQAQANLSAQGVLKLLS